VKHYRPVILIHLTQGITVSEMSEANSRQRLLRKVSYLQF